jgi:hypothetical protein
MVNEMYLEKGIDVLDKMGILEKISSNLAVQRAPAAKKLSEALGYFNEAYGFILTVLIKMTSVQLSPETMTADKVLLKEIAADTLGVKGQSISLRCQRIKNIYEHDLKRWFSSIFSGSGEFDELRQLFDEIGRSDESFVELSRYLCHNAKQNAEIILELIKHNDPQELLKAKEFVAKLDESLSPSRRRLSEHLKKLVALQERFHSITGQP